MAGSKEKMTPVLFFDAMWNARTILPRTVHRGRIGREGHHRDDKSSPEDKNDPEIAPAGLEVLYKDEWRPVPCLPDTFVVNIGGAKFQAW